LESKSTKPRNKGIYVGGYVENEHIDKIAVVEQEFDRHFGEVGRNRSRALRYIVECFDPAWLKNFPKSPAPASATTQAGNN